MTERPIYITAATHISMQQPLDEQWLTEPILHTEPYVRSIDPNFRQWLNPLEARRMGKILKRALVTASEAMARSGISNPDAIITGTGLGCIENTELILEALCRDGEQTLKPTYFMQSTHNTISSLIAIHHRCHGYNSTYSHRGVSFDAALLDAFVQLSLGDIATALVTGNDELTPSYFNILKRLGYVGNPRQVPAGEASAAIMLATEPGDNPLCRLEQCRLSYGTPPLDTLPRDVDTVMLGINGHDANDELYRQIATLYPDATLLRYKHIFGESYTASALGVYAAAAIVNAGVIPAAMSLDGKASSAAAPRRLLVVNHSDSRCLSFTLLSKP